LVCNNGPSLGLIHACDGGDSRNFDAGRLRR
jgi:hypothetical protein